MPFKSLIPSNGKLYIVDVGLEKFRSDGTVKNTIISLKFVIYSMSNASQLSESSTLRLLRSQKNYEGTFLNAARLINDPGDIRTLALANIDYGSGEVTQNAIDSQDYNSATIFSRAQPTRLVEVVSPLIVGTDFIFIISFFVHQGKMGFEFGLSTNSKRSDVVSHMPLIFCMMSCILRFD